ncbi:hypothetical protein [Pararhizobium sp. DWP1-1-3]|uniref:hypothetical protein n=1 Tax=Pararhizobium sp. DWP1-1-3 TaxID=2804652 RepID=UPI003CF6441A
MQTKKLNCAAGRSDRQPAFKPFPTPLLLAIRLLLPQSFFWRQSGERQSIEEWQRAQTRLNGAKPA